MNTFSVKISYKEVRGTPFFDEEISFEAFLDTRKTIGAGHKHFLGDGANECIVLSDDKIIATGNSLTEAVAKAREFPALTGLRFLWVKKPIINKTPYEYGLSWDPFTGAMVVTHCGSMRTVSFAQNVFKIYDENCLENVYDKCVDAMNAVIDDENFVNKTLHDITERIKQLLRQYPVKTEMNRAHLHHVNFMNGAYSLKNNVEIKFCYIDQDRRQGLKDEISFECGQTHFRKLKYSQLSEGLLALVLRIAREPGVSLSGVDQIEEYAFSK